MADFVDLVGNMQRQLKDRIQALRFLLLISPRQNVYNRHQADIASNLDERLLLTDAHVRDADAAGERPAEIRDHVFGRKFRRNLAADIPSKGHSSHWKRPWLIKMTSHRKNGPRC
jgi:hypothetical protein